MPPPGATFSSAVDSEVGEKASLSKSSRLKCEYSPC